MNDREKSDSAIGAVKSLNKAGSPVAEAMEPRAGTKGNAGQQSTHRTQTRVRVSQALDRVRQAARFGKKERFTARLHPINVDTLRLAFYALKRKAAPGVDGVTSVKLLRIDRKQSDLPIHQRLDDWPVRDLYRHRQIIRFFGQCEKPFDHRAEPVCVVRERLLNRPLRP